MKTDAKIRYNEINQKHILIDFIQFYSCSFADPHFKRFSTMKTGAAICG